MVDFYSLLIKFHVEQFKNWGNIQGGGKLNFASKALKALCELGLAAPAAVYHNVKGTFNKLYVSVYQYMYEYMSIPVYHNVKGTFNKSNVSRNCILVYHVYDMIIYDMSISVYHNVKGTFNKFNVSRNQHITDMISV